MSGPQGTAPIILPREMVLASAGSGKTYHLSSALIGLLAMGEKAEAIWASTFTRKAAAEILERVLLRLARGVQDREEGEELAGSAWMGDAGARPKDFLSQEHCGELLVRLVRSIHRANIGTLDSFFVRVATNFSEELGLPPSWSLVDGPVEDRMRSEALEAVLGMEDPSVMAELVRIMAKGEVRRGIHGHLMEQVEHLLRVHREVDPDVQDAWTPVLKGVPPGSSPSEKEVEVRCGELAEELSSMAPPLKADGEPRKLWETELPRLAEAVRTRDWKGLFQKGLGKKLIDSGELIGAGEVVYDRITPEVELASILDEAAGLARLELGRALIRQGEALGRMAAQYREVFEKAQQLQGGYRFGDVTHLLSTSTLLRSADALYFRLDAQVRHILLDEFQDTSLLQWEVLEPLVSELLGSGEGDRAGVLVADPKQSIYGWRGASPGLVARVRSRFDLKERTLEKSFRTGPVILETVARVFGGLEGNPVVGEMGGGVEGARSWLADFYDQESDDPSQPGYVSLLAGPRAEGRGAVQPALLDYAAALVGNLHTQEPRASIGVLVRTNRVVAYLIAALRQAQIPASGEGGTPLTDTAPVNALLALLRMSDHPGDRLARYHVANTPVGRVVEYTNYQAGAQASRLARRIRGRLLRDGYGATLDEWVRELKGECDQREGARLQQLVELGFRWDEQRTFRPGDFVRFVDTQKVEDPSGARVRVMTVHQAKGLQFDVVVLPHLYDSLEDRGGGDPVIPLRNPSTGKVIRVYPATDQATRSLFPELREPHEEERALGLRDELSTLYVAMTRAKYALHMVVPSDGEKGPGKAKSAARLLREALSSEVAADAEGKVLFSDGKEDWSSELKAGALSGTGDAAVTGPLEENPVPVPLRPAGGERTRNLPRRSPSSLEGGVVLDLAAHLRLDLRGDARLRGSVVHGWCEALEWMEKGLPSEEVLLGMAGRLAPGAKPDRIRDWLSDFRVWLDAPDMTHALSQSSYPDGARVERELPFLHRTPDGILQGSVDRLVLVEEDSRVVRAEVLDFKTDLVDGGDPEAMEAKVAFYRPQIAAYREAVAGRYGLDVFSVSGKLLFLRPGVVREV